MKISCTCDFRDYHSFSMFWWAFGCGIRDWSWVDLPFEFHLLLAQTRLWNFIATLFTHKVGNDVFVCQIYVDDIIFGSTNHVYCDEFSRIMTKRFEMSLMGRQCHTQGRQCRPSYIVAVDSTLVRGQIYNLHMCKMKMKRPPHPLQSRRVVTSKSQVQFIWN